MYIHDGDFLQSSFGMEQKALPVNSYQGRLFRLFFPSVLVLMLCFLISSDLLSQKQTELHTCDLNINFARESRFTSEKQVL